MAHWRSTARGFFGERTKVKDHEPSRRRRQRLAERSLRIEPFEERKLLAIDLVAVIPNEGALIPLGASPQPVLTVAPRELTIRFNEGSVIDASTLGEITLERAGFDGFANGSVPVNIGYRGIGDNLNDVIIRFTDNLPDDEYRLRIGGGLKNTAGDIFNLGNARNVSFDLNLGPQVIAVVPQPVSRTGGALSQATDTIVVYFNNDDLNAAAAQNTNSYQLIRTNNTATTLDDTRVNPISATYDNLTDRVTLKFAAGVLETAGTFRLRIGNDDPIPVAPLSITVGADPGSTFGSAQDLGTLFGGAGFESARLTSSIDPQDDVLLTTGTVPLPEFPGAIDEPGHRQVPAESHFGETAEADALGAIPTLYYNFQDIYGKDPAGNLLHNLITETQKQRVREVFSLYSKYAGVQFVESPGAGFTIATGDLRALVPNIPTGPGGVTGLANPVKQVAVMDLAEDWGQSEFGGAYFKTAMHEIGHLLGLGHTYDLPDLTIMGSAEDSGSSAPGAEVVVPGDGDIVHMRHLFRPDSKDIDTYKFTLAQQGTVSFETVAQRLTTNAPGWLDSVVSVYDAGGTLIGRNDDYFGRDAYLKLQLDAGDYFVIVTASGNTAFDPNVLDSGIGGRSEGDYELRLGFDPAPAAELTDATGVLLDGDHNGAPGGEYNFWFKTQASTSSAATNRVIWVDKATAVAVGLQDGTLARPFGNIKTALANAQPGYIVRIVGNNINADGTVNFTNAQSYNIGRDILGNELSDGAKMEVPQGVTVMIDAGAVFKMREANIDVGSSAQGIDRSAGAVQVLGTPTTNAIFTSYYDNLAGGPADVRLRRGDWGGLVFREDSDLEARGIFLNYVNHADMRYGGGQVVVNSVRDVYNPIHLVEARATLTYNKITKSADAAISADPNSFEETLFADYDGIQTPFAADYDRVGPEVYGNTLIDNSINGLFVRIATLANESLQPLTKSARFDDTDIVHVLAENLIIQGDAGGAYRDSAVLTPRLNARLAVDPGIITKLGAARIEVQLGGQFLAEATAQNPAIFTSILDDSFGRGGTFDTTNDADGSAPSPGDWAGFYFGPASSASIDHALITYAGGYSAIEGNYAKFNAVEIQQADVRIANSTLQANDDGRDTSNRNGRLTNDEATIFVRGAQPALINNVIRDGAGAAISINANALNAEFNNDPGRSIGKIDLQGDFFQNQGPLVVGNRLDGNKLNGMEVRGGTLTTESVWDDTDIVHVLYDEIVVPNYHTYGGLRLTSKPGQSLVVKLEGDSAGFTAGGSPLDINDRIGGTVQIVGQPGAPVVLTSLSDSTVGAGLKPDGTLQKETGNPGTAPAAGDWRSIKLDRYSNDRNVAVVIETEANLPTTSDLNGTPNTAQLLGGLAPNEKSGDDNLRLGYEIHGAIAQTYDDRNTADPTDDRPADVDVYSFRAKAGTEIWIDIDRSTHAFDSIVELIDANGSVVARSNDSELEHANADTITYNSPNLAGEFTRVHVMQGSEFGGKDFFTTNPRDSGMRVVLPGPTNATSTYYVRVRANSSTLSNASFGASYGNYQLQLRLRETNENPGSTVQYADIRYATNGIEVIGKPENSPLLGESAETGSHGSFGTAQDLGNLLGTNRNTLAVSGFIADGDVDWYRFAVDYNAIQSIPGVNDNGGFWPTVFDLDYADGMGRVNASLAVFDSAGNLVYWNTNGTTDDDSPRPFAGSDTTDLSRGSFGPLDPMTGSVDLREGNGQTYYVAISSSAQLPAVLSLPAFRLEPVAENERIFTNRVEKSSGLQTIGFTPEAFHLGDVVLFVNTTNDLFTVDPLTGSFETDVTGNVGNPATDFLPESGVAPFITYHDIAMRNDGRLYTLTQGTGDANWDQLKLSGNYREINTGNGSLTSSVDDEIVTYDNDLKGINVGVQFEALAHVNNGRREAFAVGNIEQNGVPIPSVARSRNLLYLLNGDGKAVDDPLDKAPDDARAPTDVRERGSLFTAPTILPSMATDAIGSVDDQAYTNPGDVLDGYTFTIEDLDGTSVTFELDSGPDIAVKSFGAQEIRDGQTITIGDGITTKTFEFDSGPVLKVASGATLTDGERFTIIDNTDDPNTVGPDNITLTFEFDNDNKIAVGSVPIKFDIVDTTAQVVANVVAAINGATFGVNATGSPGAPFVGRISLANDTFLDASSAPASVIVEGDYGLVNPANVSIPFEEVDNFSTLATSMLGAINGELTLTRSGFAERTGSVVPPPTERGDRITLLGATTIDVSGTPALSISNAVGGGPSATGVAPGRVAIPFAADDDVIDMATLVTAGINFADATVAGFDVQANRFGGQIELVGVGANVTVPAPFDIQGRGPGGLVTGLAYVGNTLYAVSDQGGFYVVENPYAYEPGFVQGTGPRLNWVATSEADLQGIPFSGLTAGPPNVEGGRYANLLFATDTAGTIYAFNTAGELQPIFLDGATSIATGIANLQGLAFSTLDYNLWHRTKRQSDSGVASYYFGMDDPRANTSLDIQPGAGNYAPRGTAFGPDSNPAVFGTYNFPGGAHGSLTTDPISLKGYTALDQPTVYFTYRLSSETTLQNIYDSARVFASTDGAKWTLLTQNLERNTGDFRQIRIPLGGFAGLDGVRLRFDFDTAGDREVGTNNYSGEILRGLAAHALRDGDTFTIDGTIFEFDLGFTAITQAGKTINDGDTLVLNGTTFEFNKTGGVGVGAVAVPIGDQDSAGTVAMNLVQSINLQGIGVNARLDEGITVNVRPKDQITDGDTVTIDGVTFEFDLDDDVTPGNNSVLLEPTDISASDVAKKLAQQITLLGSSGPAVANGGKVLVQQAQTASTVGTSATVVATSARINLVGAMTATESGNSIILDGEVGVQLGRVPVVINTAMNAAGVAHTMGLAIDSVLVPAAGNVDDPAFFQSIRIDGDLIHVIGHHVADPGPLPWWDSLIDPDPEQVSTDHPQKPPFIPFPDRFFENTRGQRNDYEGLYIDDIILGFAARGEQGLFANGNTAFVGGGGSSTDIVVGNYDLEIRRGREPMRGGPTPYPILPTDPDPIGRKEVPDGTVPKAIDVRDRLADVVTVVTAPGAGITEGETLRVSDGVTTIVFEFDSDASWGSDVQPDGSVIARTPIAYTSTMTDGEVAAVIVGAINGRYLAGAFKVRAVASATDGRVELFDAQVVTQAPFTLNVSAGANIMDGDLIRIFDGNQWGRFEFDNNASVGFDSTPIPYAPAMTAGQVASAVASAINGHFFAKTFKVRASAVGVDGRVELFDAMQVETTGSTTSQMHLGVTSQTARDINDDVAIGDKNQFRDQGYTVIASNIIQDSLGHNIVVDSPTRLVTNQPQPGSIRNLREINAQRLVPGISIYNNLLVAGGEGGILFSGNTEAGAPGAAPFGRITNNTIYGEGAGVGIRVDDGASPTITNNIIAATAIGVDVVNSGGTVLGTNLYQDNGVNRQGATETFNIDLATGQPLFVDAANRNFYLAAGTKAIDSSRDSLQDRVAMTTVTGPLGIPPSPILAPNTDLLGQLRVDDTTVNAPPIPGQGLNVFKDRGAIDRADFFRSTVAIVGPLDNDAAGLDTNPAPTHLQLFGQKIPSFSFQFNDGTGTGIDDNSITAAQVTFKRDGQPVPPNEFSYSYDTTNDVIRLQATSGIFGDGVYTVEFNNLPATPPNPAGIRDIAGNLLLPNQGDGRTLFTIEVAASALAPWQNPGNYEYAALDVNNSGFVSAIDAGIVYDYIKRNGIGPLPLPAAAPPYLDVNGDGACTPIDLALIIDHLNARAAGTLASFESSDTGVASMFESAAPVVGSHADVAFGLSVGGTPQGAADNLFAAPSQATAASAHAAAVDVAFDDYAPEESLESIDLFDASASEEDAFDALFDDVEALLI